MTGVFLNMVGIYLYLMFPRLVPSLRRNYLERKNSQFAICLLLSEIISK